MRLLSFDDEGGLRLTELCGEIPPYVILSHTWGNDSDEVTYRDKIQFCGKQALKDGYTYFWVDTCCIDKSDSAELQVAINSMFRWYQRSRRCYVYLRDVSTNDEDWEDTFRRSRWFTRGWTLQELIAPSSVEFFSSDGQRLGYKKFAHELLSWATGRQTKREEDKVYSLQGMFMSFYRCFTVKGKNQPFGGFERKLPKLPLTIEQEVLNKILFGSPNWITYRL
ncbi:heterokaryon incompatibility protein-domain-containing protein [Lipomyces starkeyi]